MGGREKRRPKRDNQEPGHDKWFALNPVCNGGAGGAAPKVYKRGE